MEHACSTFEGEAVWQAVCQSSGWAGGGMIPRRVNRAAIHARLPDVEPWIIEALLDAFEPTALAAAASADKKRPKAGVEKPENKNEGQAS